MRPTSSTTDDILIEIDQLLKPGKPLDAPERRLTHLIHSLPPAELSKRREDILKRVAGLEHGFVRPGRRRKRLSQLIHDRLTGTSTQDATCATNAPGVSAHPPTPPQLQSLLRLIDSFRYTLDDLSQRHIFQWAIYQDRLAKHFESLLGHMTQAPPTAPGDSLADLFASHSRTIYTKGYRYVSSNLRNHDDAIQKSLNGLSRFLDLIIGFYSARTSSFSQPSDYGAALALRFVVSSALRGILEGYSNVEFGRQTGRELLPRFQRQWVRYVLFLTPPHATRIIDHIESGPLSAGLRTAVLPLLHTIQKTFDVEHKNHFLLPTSAQFLWIQRRLDVTILSPTSPSQQLFRASVFLEEGFSTFEDVEDAVRRHAPALVIAPLRSDVRRIVERQPEHLSVVVPIDDTQPEGATDRAFRTLNATVLESYKSRIHTLPVISNLALDFPLASANLRGFFRVPRTSINDMLRIFERRSGIRLWCSVRRSGKTMACYYMASTSGDSIVIPQTFGASEIDDSDGQEQDGQQIDKRLHMRIAGAMESGKMISQTFIGDVISECAPTDTKNKKIVLIIDEYEGLFHLLKEQIIRNPNIRHSIAFPILNQLTSFSRRNLLVLLGQRPDAYSVLMSQNQLAPNVEQDSFPLFAHQSGTKTGEFSDLLRRILPGNTIRYTTGLLDVLFRETAGHPFLTVAVLREFIGWLINDRQPRIGVTVTEEDFAGFTDARLDRNGIMISDEFEILRGAAANALSMWSYRDEPWLYAVYWTLRKLAGESTFSVRESEFRDVIADVPVPQMLRTEGADEGIPTWAEVLRTATKSNFLSRDGDRVKIKIPTLGRIAAAVRPNSV